MGFKLKKKNTGESTGGRKGGNALLARLQSQTDQLSRVFGDSEKSKPFIYGAIGSLVFATLILFYLFYSVPRGTN